MPIFFFILLSLNSSAWNFPWASSNVGDSSPPNPSAVFLSCLSPTYFLRQAPRWEGELLSYPHHSPIAWRHGGDAAEVGMERNQDLLLSFFRIDDVMFQFILLPHSGLSQACGESVSVWCWCFSCTWSQGFCSHPPPPQTLAHFPCSTICSSPILPIICSPPSVPVHIMLSNLFMKIWGLLLLRFVTSSQGRTANLRIRKDPS